MFKLSAIELAICLIPLAALIVGIIAFAVSRRKQTKRIQVDHGEAFDAQPGQSIQPQQGGEKMDLSDESGSTLPVPYANNSNNGFAITSLVLGILSIGVLIVPILLRQINSSISFSFCLGPLAIVAGVISLVQTNKRGNKGKGAAIIGIVLGILPFIYIIYSLLMLISFSAASP